MNFRTALVAASVLALPAAAFAQPVDGLYVGAGIGYNYAQDQSVKSAPGTNLTTNGGLMGSLSVGMGFGGVFRAELQGDYRNYHQTASQGGGSGLNQTYGGFVNGLYDFSIDAPVTPYVGLGLGYEDTHLSSGKVSATAGSIAGQVILGASFPITDVAGLSATAEYRFMTTFENETFSSGGNSVKVGPQYNHGVLVGLHYAFGAMAPMAPAAAPAPAPAKTVAPAPAPARTYLVFFDWDKADLTARAKQIISEAAANVARVAVTRIEVSGHADKSGTAGYNQTLSQHRADNVAAELVRLGVPKAEIAVMAFGDTQVPTADGVREPQNRRVEIVLK